MKKSENVIILDRMYAGTYIDENIGHEVINLFKDDNGDNYIYISEDGKINPKYNDSVDAVLFVRHIEKGVMEIIAKAEGLEQVLYKTGNVNEESKSQVEYINKNHITYGGVPIYKVHNDTVEEKITITFKAKDVRLVKKAIYLVEDRDKISSYEPCVFLPQKHFSLQSLKMYYDKTELSEDYGILTKLVADSSIWEEQNTTQKLDLGDYSDIVKNRSFLNIIRKENDELVYSNLLAYFFEENKPLFVEFAKEVLEIDGFSSKFNRIVRESNNNIDLWIEDENNVIVIENKIKSKINGEKHDVYSDDIQSQLEKYYQYAKQERPNKDIHCFVFAPNYNNINLSKYPAGKYYKTVNYGDIYAFYFKNAGRMLHIGYFREFIDALDRHSKTVDRGNFEIMKERFIERIIKLNDSGASLYDMPLDYGDEDTCVDKQRSAL